MSSVFSHFQDFLQKAYGDDPPAKIPPEVAGVVLCVAGNKGVRTSHKTLTTAGSSKADWQYALEGKRVGLLSHGTETKLGKDFKF